jgi:hypothetical protein
MDATVDDRTVLRHLRTLSTSSRSTSSCPQSASLLRSGRPYQHGMSPRRRRVYGSPGWMRIRNTVPVNHIVWMRVSPVGVDHSAATGSQSVELTESFSTTSIVLNEHYEEACRSSLHQPLLLYLGKPREWKGNKWHDKAELEAPEGSCSAALGRRADRTGPWPRAFTAGPLPI